MTGTSVKKIEAMRGKIINSNSSTKDLIIPEGMELLIPHSNQVESFILYSNFAELRNLVAPQNRDSEYRIF